MTVDKVAQGWFTNGQFYATIIIGKAPKPQTTNTKHMTTATVSAPLTLRIYQHDAALAENLVGQQSLMAIICEETLSRYSLSELNTMQMGQFSKLMSVERKVVEAMNGKVIRRTDLWNYHAKNGGRAEGSDVFHTVLDEDADEARFWAQVALDNTDR